MADESSQQERTEAPTPKRRSDSRRKGQVPTSPEVTTAFLLLAGAGVIAGAMAGTATALVDVFRLAAGSLSALPVGVDGHTAFLRQVGLRTLAGAAPALLALAGTALAVSALQARGVVTLEPLQPRLTKLDPLTRIPQLWGWRALNELVKSLLKLALVALVTWSALAPAQGELLALVQQSPPALLLLARKYAVRILLHAGLAYLLLALADYAWQVWRHEKRLRMSREDVKNELKESEGDQVLRVRRRTMARQLARRRMLLSVSEADVVVTNPTHIAVALAYDPLEADAPVVLAMGERKVAERIKELARAHGVPLVENKPLARALFATARVGQSIPVELFVAVAEILAWVYRQAGYGAGRRRPTAGSAVPAAPAPSGGAPPGAARQDEAHP
jgi:flagellar biosynthetic protein FlhB